MSSTPKPPKLHLHRAPSSTSSSTYTTKPLIRNELTFDLPPTTTKPNKKPPPPPIHEFDSATFKSPFLDDKIRERKMLAAKRKGG
jgi:hypothetical protein